jgi:8-oxo-dGTP pyrophosphatase MutT (NUDIX family)
VLREVREETGRDCFAVRAALGVEEYRIDGDTTHVRHFYALDATAQLPETWEAAEEHDGQRPPTPLVFSWVAVNDAHVLAAGLGARLAELTGY